MKIKTNVRAGSQTRSRGSDNPAETQPVYVPPVSRCVGI